MELIPFQLLGLLSRIPSPPRMITLVVLVEVVFQQKGQFLGTPITSSVRAFDQNYVRTCEEFLRPDSPSVFRGKLLNKNLDHSQPGDKVGEHFRALFYTYYS